ncbi:MAG: TetR/AcrR family transcriptional regulator [Candidatus Nanopelagicales bacterium]
MGTDTRTRMLVAGTELFRDRGYDGTGFRDVVARADAARGSIYHHFPGGKSQLAAEVVERTGGRISELIERECVDHDPQEALARLGGLAERIVLGGALRPGCPVAAVTMAADDPDGQLRAVTTQVFQRWQLALASCLQTAGAAPADATRFATLTVAAVEGALLLCRASGEPTALRDVIAALQAQLEQILPKRNRST